MPKATPCPLWLRTIHWIVRLTRRAPRNSPNTSPNALRKEWNWSHWDIAILCKSVVFASGTPSRHPHPVPCSHYATSVLGASQLVPQNSRTKCRPGHSRDSALRSRFRLRMSESAYLLRYGQAELFNMLATRSVKYCGFWDVDYKFAF